MAYGEVAVPPFGYCFMPDDESTDTFVRSVGLAEITQFFDYEFGHGAVVFLNLRVLQPIGVGPLQYA